MTHRKLNKLLISIICLLTILLLMTRFGWAEDEITWHGGGYVVGKFSGGAGYTPGIGIVGEAQARWRFLEVKLSATTAWQKKKAATFGYTWAANGQLRGFFWKDFYAVGAYSIAGYRSYFKNGNEWTKYGDNVGLGLGWETDFVDLNLIYYLKETSSPNNVQFTTLSARYQIWKYLWAIGGLTYQTYDQMWSGNLERWSSMNWTIGLGVRF